MNERKHFLISIAVALAALLLGGAVLVWPTVAKRQAVRAEIESLERKIKGVSDEAKTVSRLEEELADLRRRASEEMKQIPSSPDMAGIMRRLSLPVDGRTVRDQTFTAGSPMPAISGEETPEAGLPLTVDMEADFEAVFALLRTAERMDRLVNVQSLNLVSPRAQDVLNTRQRRRASDAEAAEDEEGGLLDASVGLEVIYVGNASGEEEG